MDGKSKQSKRRADIWRGTDICTAIEVWLRPKGLKYAFTAEQVVAEIQKPGSNFKFNGYNDGRPLGIPDIGRAMRALEMCKVIQRVAPWEETDLMKFWYQTGKNKLTRRWHERDEKKLEYVEDLGPIN